MAHLHLPAQHSDDDLAIAGAIAQVLRSEELYVAWSSENGAGEPVIPAKLHTPHPDGEPEIERQRQRHRQRGGLLARLFGLRRAG